MATKKAATKKAKNRNQSGRFAASAASAPKPAIAPVAEPEEKKSPVVKIEVDSSDVEKLGEQALKVQDAFEALQHLLDTAVDAGEKRLHRRVVYAVYDGEGTRLNRGSYDLKATEAFRLVVDGDTFNVGTEGSRA